MRESRTIIATIMIGVLIVGLCACTGMPDGDNTNEQTTEVESTEWCLVDTPKGYERHEHGKEISFDNDQGSQIWIHIIEKKGYSDAWYYMNSDTSRTLDHAEKRGNYMWLISKYWSREEDGSTKPWVYAYTDVSDNKKEEIEDKIDDYYEEVIEDELFKTKTWYEKTWIIIKEYALFVLIPLIIISIVYIIRIKIIKKKGELK